ncbi:MAG TPA: hypothetical protein VKZ55_08820, partial [Microthrixaceae bacterium]|nr:hypothetical protein [Microthrixaceae bacterium]
MRTRSRLVAVIAMVGFASLAAACVPPPEGGGGGPDPINWSFRGTSMTVNNVQDEVCVIVC